MLRFGYHAGEVPNHALQATPVGAGLEVLSRRPGCLSFVVDAMSFRRSTKIVGLLVPGILFLVVCAVPYYSDRVSLIVAGLQLARIVPKEKLNVFDFVDTDFMKAQAIAFSGGKPVGWIYAPESSLPRYVAISKARDFDPPPPEHFEPWLDYRLVVIYVRRWWLPIFQFLVFVVWATFSARKKPPIVAGI